MSVDEIQCFEQLKEAVAHQFRKAYPDVTDGPDNWKGQSILLFQEDLMEKVNDQVSEKWFYTHMKGRSDSLPRIDMLNLLSRYAGFRDWQEFRYAHQEQLPVELEKSNSNRVFVVIPLITIGIMLAFLAGFKLLSWRNYEYCLVSRDDPADHPVNARVSILHENESPRLLIANPDGCVSFRTDAIKLTIVVSAPYYKTDTLVRTLKKFGKSETIQLEPDDQAMMLHYFNTNDTELWLRRRNQLNTILSDSAMIYEVLDSGTTSVELYNKNEFIDKLSVPSASLNNIRLLDIQYDNDKIVYVRFTHDDDE